MNVFGLSITRTKQVGMASVDSRGGWWPLIRENVAGAWQRDIEITVDNVTTNPTLFACATLIASDIAKMRVRLVQDLRGDDVWSETESPSFSPVLRAPNHFQNHIQFFMAWSLSKSLWGNTYVFKERDDRHVVTRQYVLDPSTTRPLVAPDRSVYYEVRRDDLAGLPSPAGYVFPASEIIHDRYNFIFHPLVGLSPIYAAGVAAVQGLNIINSSTTFFQNGANPGGVLTAPGAISQATADRLKAYWDANFTGDNAGKIAVLGDDLKFEKMRETAVNAQLIEQLKWTDEAICRAFRVPPYMVGVGPIPNYNNIEALSRQYYQQCLQELIESIELCLDDGLGLTTGDIMQKRYGTEFDLDNLMRMDTATMVSTEKEAVLGGLRSPNEARRRLNHPPVVGGNSPMMQQQQFSLEALAERDRDKPFAKPTAPPPATPAPTVNEADEKMAAALMRKELGMAA